MICDLAKVTGRDALIERGLDTMRWLHEEVPGIVTNIKRPDGRVVLGCLASGRTLAVYSDDEIPF